MSPPYPAFQIDKPNSSPRPAASSNTVTPRGGSAPASGPPRKQTSSSQAHASGSTVVPAKAKKGLQASLKNLTRRYHLARENKEGLSDEDRDGLALGYRAAYWGLATVQHYGQPISTFNHKYDGPALDEYNEHDEHDEPPPRLAIMPAAVASPAGPSHTTASASSSSNGPRSPTTGSQHKHNHVINGKKGRKTQGNKKN